MPRRARQVRASDFGLGSGSVFKMTPVYNFGLRVICIFDMVCRGLFAILQRLPRHTVVYHQRFPLPYASLCSLQWLFPKHIPRYTWR